MTCFICLCEGGLGRACPCTASVHAKCLAEFLKRGAPPRCPVCFAAFTSAARVAATALLFQEEPTTANMLNLATILTIDGSPTKAMVLLKNALPVEPAFFIPYHLEVAHAFLALGDADQALPILSKCLDVFFEAQDKAAACPSIFAHALVLTAKAHLLRGEVRFADGAVTCALSMAAKLALEDGLEILYVIRDICAARGDAPRLVAAQKAIYAITSREVKDPWEVAHAHAELLLATIAHQGGGADVAAPLKNALRILRKRPSTDGVAARASVALAGLVRPQKRLRAKRHPEAV